MFHQRLLADNYLARNLTFSRRRWHVNHEPVTKRHRVVSWWVWIATAAIGVTVAGIMQVLAVISR